MRTTVPPRHEKRFWSAFPGSLLSRLAPPYPAANRRTRSLGGKLHDLRGDNGQERAEGFFPLCCFHVLRFYERVPEGQESEGNGLARRGRAALMGGTRTRRLKAQSKARFSATEDATWVVPFLLADLNPCHSTASPPANKTAICSGPSKRHSERRKGNQETRKQRPSENHRRRMSQHRCDGACDIERSCEPEFQVLFGGK